MSDMWNTTETITYELPDWMRQARRGVDWGVLFVIALSLIAAWPFILYPNLPHTNASENYVYRTTDYADALREGRFYPRWSPNVLGGYGAPIPNYYPPGATYGAALLDVLLTDDPVTAVRLTYIVSLCIAGASVYVFVTRRCGATSGMLSALLYVYSPYVGLIAPHVLGDLPGVVSLALIPTLLWAIDRLLLANRPLDVLFIALATGLLCVTSVQAALVSVLLVVGLIVWHWWFQDSKAPVWLAIASVLLGIGLASFYWLPAFLEQDAVHWRMNSFSIMPLRLTVADLFTPLRSLDPNDMVVSSQLTIGVLGSSFGLVGLAAMLRFRRKVGFQGFFLISGVVILAIALLVFPGEIWLLGPAMLCLSIGGSAALFFGERLPRRRRRLILPALVILIWVGSTQVWFAPRFLEVFGDTDPATQVQYEQQGYGIAVLPPGNLLPTSLPDTLASNRSLLVSYQSDTINKIAPGQVSVNLQISPLTHLTHSDHFLIRRVATPTPLEILTAYFPGWYATLADHPVALTRSENGLMLANLPVLSSTGSELIVTLGPTDVRTSSWVIAGVLLLIIFVITQGRIRRRKIVFEEMILLSRSETRLMVVPIACFILITLAFSYGNLPTSLWARPGYDLDNSIYVNTRTDAGLSLLAFRLNTNQYRAGDLFNLTLYWQAQRNMTENYRIKLYLVNNRDGSVWDETQFRQPGDYPTRRWNTRQYVTDRYGLHLPLDMTAGNYQIRIEVSDCNPDCSTGSQVIFFDATGENQGIVLILPTLIAVNR